MSKKSSSAPRTGGGWLKLLSFIAVMLLGLGLAISFALSWIDGMGAVGAWIRNIAILIALPVPVILSYYEAWRKKTVWRVLWIIAVVLIVVFFFIGLPELKIIK